MSGTSRRRILIGIFVLQVVVLLAVVSLHGARVASGTHVLLATRPVDPLDLARGAYVDLAYDDIQDLQVPKGLSDGDDVYVVLQRPADPDTVWKVLGVAAEPGDITSDPDAFIWLQADSGRVDTTAIDTYYGSADESIRLERDLADGGVAEVSLDRDGNPTLVEVRGAAG
jgi:hypothetical protein